MLRGFKDYYLLCTETRDCTVLYTNQLIAVLPHTQSHTLCHRKIVTGQLSTQVWVLFWAFTKPPLFQRNRLTGSGNPSFESFVELKAQ